MNPLNLLERAKGYVAAKASKIALTVVPLAALAAITVPAHATAVSGVTLIPTSCVVSIGSGSCTDDQASTIGGNTHANWLELFTTGAVSPGGGNDEVLLFASGSASGLFSSGQTIPVAWDFFINGNSGGTVNWDVLFQVFTSSGSSSIDPSNTADIPNGGPATEVQGTSSLFVGASSITGYGLQLTVIGPNSDPYSVTVPGGGTIDFNQSTQSATPEPSSLALAVSGLLGLLVSRRKKRS
jgi:hypothetical protein